MSKRRKNPPLRVLLNGRNVGILSRASSGAVDFKYDQGWLDDRAQIPVSLSLPLREDRYIGQTVLNVFENLLPDNKSIRDRVAARVQATGTDAFSLLSKIGHDCIGALQFIPADSEPGKTGTTTGKPISDEEIARKLNDLGAAPLGMDDDEDFRISIAGAQEKTALLFHEGRWFTPSGTTATTHILKPQIGQIPNSIDLSNSVENEFLCLKICAALGLRVANAEIVDFAGTRALSVERFDRQWMPDGRLFRLPQEDMCQALSVPPTLKYQADHGPDNQAIMGLLKASDVPTEDQTAYLKAQIVFWLLGATDGHAKNFSVFLMPGSRFQLTPLYDVLTAEPSFAAREVSKKSYKLAMSVGANNHYRIDEISPRHFIQTTDRCGFDRAVITRVFDNLLGSAEMNIKTVYDQLAADFPEQLSISTLEGIKRRLRIVEEWRK
jgi:serine/threonine-protein kinase HipA